MKNILVSSFFLICSFFVNAQVTQTHQFKDKKLENRDDKWFISDCRFNYQMRHI